jgi:predicted ATPase
MHIQKLQIEHLRSFTKAEIELNLPGTEGLSLPNVNVLLGGNGLGKTGILRAFALSALGPLLSGPSGYIPTSLIRRRPLHADHAKRPLLDLRKPFATAHIVSTAEDLQAGHDTSELPEHFSLKTEVRPLGSAETLKWSVMPRSIRDNVENLQFDEASAAFFVVGYGATRRVEASERMDSNARKIRNIRYERVASLFEDHVTLVPLGHSLPMILKKNPNRYKEIVNLVNSLLPDNCQMLGNSGDDPEQIDLFQMNNIALPFKDLSDGFRAHIGWIADMLHHAAQVLPDGTLLRDLQGVAMVDEIDLHLHPEWQRTVVPALAAALPKMQFVFTTHSPLVVTSLSSHNLFVLGQREESTIVRRLPESIQGKGAEQILLSPYFGLNSTRSVDFSTHLEDLAIQAASGNEQASLDYLKAMADGFRSSQRTVTAETRIPRSIKASLLKKAVKTTKDEQT